MHNFVIQDISGLPFQINWTNSAILMTHKQPVILEQKNNVITIQFQVDYTHLFIRNWL